VGKESKPRQGTKVHKSHIEAWDYFQEKLDEKLTRGYQEISFEDSQNLINKHPEEYFF